MLVLGLALGLSPLGLWVPPSTVSSADSVPECTEAVGTPAYLAPEVLAISQAKKLWQRPGPSQGQRAQPGRL